MLCVNGCRSAMILLDWVCAHSLLASIRLHWHKFYCCPSEWGVNDQLSVIETSLPTCLHPALVLPTCPVSRPSLLDELCIQWSLSAASSALECCSVQNFGWQTFVICTKSQPPKGNLWTNLFCFLFFSLFKFHLEYIPDWALGRGQFFTMIGDVTVLVAALCSAVWAFQH